MLFIKKCIKKTNLLQFLLILCSLISISFFPALASGQDKDLKKNTDQGTTISDKPSFHSLAYLGDFFPKDILPATQAELNLSGEQMKIIERLKAAEIHGRQMESHNFPESIPVSSDEEKSMQNDIGGIIDQLSKSLGNEKLEDFCQWIAEENDFDRVRIGRKQDDQIDIITRSNQIVDQLINSRNYLLYKAKKTQELKLKYISDAFFYKHEEGLKLRILWDLEPSDVLLNQLIRSYIPNEITSAQVDLGKKYYKKHLYEKAIKEYQLAIDENSLNYDAYGLMGYSYLKNKQVEKALTALKKSIELNDLYIMGHYNLALAYWENKMENKSIQEIKKVIQLDPTYEFAIEADAQFRPIIDSNSYKSWETEPNRFYLTREDRSWRENRLILSGFTDCFKDYMASNRIPGELSEGFKNELRLTDDQMAEINKLLSLSDQISELLRWTHDPGTIDAKSKKRDEAYEKFSEGVIQLPKNLGKERFKDLCQ